MDEICSYCQYAHSGHRCPLETDLLTVAFWSERQLPFGRRDSLIIRKNERFFENVSITPDSADVINALAGKLLPK